MAYFRLYVLNAKNRVLRATDLAAPHKMAGVDEALVMLAPDTQWFAFELWQNARQVHKEFRADVTKSAVPATRTARSVTSIGRMSPGA